MAEDKGHHHKKIEIPIHNINVSVIETEFNSVREKFEAAMKKMEEDLTQFHDQVQQQAQVVQQNITQVASDTAEAIAQHLNSPLVIDSDGQKVLRVRFDVSGFAADEVKVEVVGDKLVVQATHEEKTDTRNIYKQYRNEFSLPNGVKPEKIEPVLSTDGILTVKVYLPQSPVEEK